MATNANITDTRQHILNVLAETEIVKSTQEGDKRIEFHAPKDLVVTLQKLVQLEQDLEEKCGSRSTPLVNGGSGGCCPLV